MPVLSDYVGVLPASGTVSFEQWKQDLSAAGLRFSNRPFVALKTQKLIELAINRETGTLMVKRGNGGGDAN